MRLAIDRVAFSLCFGLGLVDLLAIDLVFGPRALGLRTVVEAQPEKGVDSIAAHLEAVLPPAPPSRVPASPPEMPGTEAPFAAPPASVSPATTLPTAATAHRVVYFAKSLRRLDSAARGAIDAAALELRRNVRTTVIIAGHADPSGPSELNDALSVGRARAVASRLRRAGIAAARIRIEAYGARRPLDAAERSRRVEIVFVGGGE